MGGFVAYDPRVTIEAGWYAATGIWLSAGGPVFGCPAESTGALSFSPSGTVDTLDTYYYQGSGVGEFTIDDGNAVVATVDAQKSDNRLVKHTTGLTRGSGKTIRYARTQTHANAVYLAGVLAYDAQSPAVDLINAGWLGSQSADWIKSEWPWSPANAIRVIAPDLTVIGLGANDMREAASVPVETFRANLSAVIGEAKASGDVVLLVESFGMSPGWGSPAIKDAFRRAIIGLGAANHCMVVDLASHFVSHSEADALGLFFDGIHENATGYADAAEFLARALVSR